MGKNHVTVTHLTPAMGQILVGASTTQFPSLRNAFFVGDLLTKKDCRKLRNLAPNATVINLYGTTETQRAVSFFEVPSRAPATLRFWITCQTLFQLAKAYCMSSSWLSIARTGQGSVE